MRLSQTQIILNASMVAEVDSKPQDLNQVPLYSIQAVWTGSPVGSLKLQLSNDIINSNPPQAYNPIQIVNWTDYSGSLTVVNGAGNFVWNCLDVGYRWVRLVYVFSSGTGTLNATFCGKGI